MPVKGNICVTLLPKSQVKAVFYVLSEEMRGGSDIHSATLLRNSATTAGTIPLPRALSSSTRWERP